MRKIKSTYVQVVLIAAALIFSVALVGCGGGDEEYGYQTYRLLYDNVEYFSDDMPFDYDPSGFRSYQKRCESKVEDAAYTLTKSADEPGEDPTVWYFLMRAACGPERANAVLEASGLDAEAKEHLPTDYEEQLEALR